ncbi:MAG: anthranilate synthase component I [Verrucomicrobiota bacterium]
MLPALVSSIPVEPLFEHFEAFARESNCIPVYTELTADYETPLSAFGKITKDGEDAFLLESAEKDEHLGRYSFVGSQPRAVFKAVGSTVAIEEKGKAPVVINDVKDPLVELQNYMARFHPADDPLLDLPVFSGGAVGYLAYDAVKYFEPTVGAVENDELGLPEMIFFIADTILIFDHRFRKLKILHRAFLQGESAEERVANARGAYDAARAAIDAVVAQLQLPFASPSFNTLDYADELETRSNTSREEYMSMVEKAKEFIRAGDAFQIVPSQRFEADFAGTPTDLYRSLRAVNPSPYMFCLQFSEGFSLVGCSPEVHVRAIDGNIAIRPIAGTRWRGKTKEEDDALADELLNDPKERAEHIMLVDLARNDVGRVAEFESVTVDDFMIIERYSHVMHIVSNVSGKLKPECSAYDVMRATFPAGTVSGAPKVRAMQIINDLEKSKRCTYAGAVGYFGFDGNHDSCIALRTAVVKDGKVYVQAGAGVVADSDPAYEYTETVNKARAIIRAVAKAPDGSP